jgi:chaperonin cofactor prefoldin
MKLLDLLNEIEETEKNYLEPVKEEKSPMVDEIGKFFVTEKPTSKEDKIEDLVFESTVLYFANQVRGGLKEENVLGIYKQKSDARRAAAEAIKQYETSLKEMEDAMEAFRSAKTDIEEKKKVAKEKIMKLK